MPNASIYTANSTNSMFYRVRGSGTTYYHSCAVGYFAAPTSSAIDGGFRFTGISLSQGASVDYARLGVYVQEKGGSVNIKVKIEGIDEDNTDPFTSSYSNPFGRSRTTASATAELDTGIGVGSYWKTFDLTSIIEEIVGRGGWSSGNAMGFVLTDNGTSTSADNYFADQLTSTNTYLAIRASALPDTSPSSTNKNVYHNNLKENYGLKISRNGRSAESSDLNDLAFTSRLPSTQGFKPGIIRSFGKTNSTVTVKHGLGYIPKVIAYMKDESNQCFKIPQTFQDAFKEDFYVTYAAGTENIVFTASTYVSGASIAEDYTIEYFIMGENLSIV